jgi:hypothetical protein
VGFLPKLTFGFGKENDRRHHRILIVKAAEFEVTTECLGLGENYG